MKFAIYAEHSASAGEQCHDEEMIERESDDIVIYEAETDQEWLDLESLAMGYANNTLLGGTGAYYRKVGETLLDIIDTYSGLPN